MNRFQKRLAKRAMTAGVVAATSLLGAGAAGAAGASGPGGDVPAPWVRDVRPGGGDALTESTAVLDRLRFGWPRCTPLPHGIPCDIFQRQDRPAAPAPQLADPFPVGIPADLVVPSVPELVDTFPHGIPAEPVAPAVPSIVDAFPHGIPADLVHATPGLGKLVAPAGPSVLDAFPHGIPADLVRATPGLTGSTGPGVDVADAVGSLGDVMPHGVPAVTAVDAIAHR